MNPTFSESRIAAAVESASEYVEALVRQYRADDQAAIAHTVVLIAVRVAGELDDSADSGRRSYREYLTDQLREIDAEAVLEVLDYPDSYELTGLEGVKANIVGEVQQLGLMDRADWASAQDELARDEAVQARIDQARGK